MNIKKYFDEGAAKDTWAVVWRFLLVLLAIAAFVGMIAVAA